MRKLKNKLVIAIAFNSDFIVHFDLRENEIILNLERFYFHPFSWLRHDRGVTTFKTYSAAKSLSSDMAQCQMRR